MKRNSTITCLVVIVAVATGFGTGWVANDYSKSGQTLEQQIVKVLRQNVENGMTIDDLANLVGPDMLDRNYKIPESVQESFRHLWQERGSAAQPGDAYCAIKIGNTTYALHFRDSKLINCEPNIDFGDPESMVSAISG